MISVGRAPESALVLDDPQVSGRHALIYVENGKVHVADLGSTNGVFVNGERVGQMALTPVDDVRIGECRLKVELQGAPAQEAARATAGETTQVGAKIAPPPQHDRTDPGGIARPVREPRAPEPEPPAPQPTAPDAPRARSRQAPIRDPEPAPPPAAIRPLPPRPPPRPPPEPAAAAAGAPPPGVAAPVPAPAPSADAFLAELSRPADRAASIPREPHDPSPRADGNAALELMPPPPEGHEELDEEELEERSFVPPFSLLENVVHDRMQDGVKGQDRPVVEVIRYRDNRLVDVARLDPGTTYKVFDEEKVKTARLIKARRDGKARLFIRSDLEGNVVIGGRAASVAAMCSPQHLADRKRGIYAMDLAEGDYAQVKIQGGGYLVRFVRSPSPPPSKVEMRLGREERNYLIVGVAGIVLMLAGIVAQSYLSPPELIVQEEAAEFAEISLKDLEMEKKPEPPPPPPEVVAPPEAPAVPEPQPKPSPLPKARPERTRPRPARSSAPKAPAPSPPSAAQNALAALDNLGPPTSAPKLSTAVSNIAAVRVPAGAPSSFAVAGAIGKLPGNEVTVSTGGRAGGRDTRAAAALLAGKDVGALKGGGGSGKVRGKLDRPPARSVGTKGGSLAREDILKVVAAAFGSISSCYERQLMKDGSLEGKLVMDWVIDPTGRVSSTRVRSSSIRSEEVATCVSRVIRGLKFPRPTGGSVTVTFPFAFRSASF